MSKTMRQLIPNKRSKAVRKLTNHPEKKRMLLKNCLSKKKTPALKREILNLKRCNANLKLQLHEQKLENASLNRKYLHLESETHKLQTVNATLKEENKSYEKLINNAEPDIRSCMTHLVETSQTLANLQMAINKNRSRQQLSKIGGSLAKTKSHVPICKTTQFKFNKTQGSVAPRRKQLVRPMVQGLTLFTNLTIPLQRVSLPTQNARTHIQVPVVDSPREEEAINIDVKPETSGSTVFKRRRRNLHYVKNKPKRFVMKAESDARHSKNFVKTEVHFCANEECEPAESSESETEVKNYLKPIVLIRDFNMPCPKSKRNLSSANHHSANNVAGKSLTSLVDNNMNEDNPLEGTSKMFLESSSPVCSLSKCLKESQGSCPEQPVDICDEDMDSDSDCDNVTNCDKTSDTSNSKIAPQSSMDLGIASNEDSQNHNPSEECNQLEGQANNESKLSDRSTTDNLESVECSQSLSAAESSGSNNSAAPTSAVVRDGEQTVQFDNVDD